jgi:hypothetical protein
MGVIVSPSDFRGEGFPQKTGIARVIVNYNPQSWFALFVFSRFL